jgi:hypothetical protein
VGGVVWVFLSALANKWLWLFAVFATAVLLVLPGVPVGLALGAGVLVLGAGAGADALGDVRRARRLPGGERPAVRARVRDPEAAAHIRRAVAGTERLERAQESMAQARADVATDVGVHAGQMLDALQHTGRQVDRLDVMLGGVDPGALSAELAEVERVLSAQPGAASELTEQRLRTAEGLRAQLAAYRRVSEQRLLMLERMRATAVGIEGLAVRVGEIGALYESTGQVDTSAEDLRAVTGEIEVLREGLVEAERTVRAALSSTDLPGIPDVPEPPDGSPPR